MKIKRYFVTLCMFLIMILTVACFRTNDIDSFEQDTLDWTDKLTLSSSEYIILDNDEETSVDFNSEKTSESSDNPVTDANNSNNGNDDVSVGVSMNILSSENMPLATDTLEYKGSDMSYAAYVTNNCSFTADFTFFIIINGYLQPFTLKGSEEESYSANFVLEAGEEKIIYYSFTPIFAPYNEKAVVSFMGMTTNKTPVLDDALSVFMNSVSAYMNFYLTAESNNFQIEMDENKNIMGNAIRELKPSSNGESSQVFLSDKKENDESYSKIRMEALNSDNNITSYASRIDDAALRILLWCEGEFIPVFDGEYYADIPDNEYALYEIPIDNSFIESSSNQRCSMIYIDMSLYQQAVYDNVQTNCVNHSQVYVIS